MLAGLPVLAEIPRAARRAHVRRRQGGGDGRLDSGGVPRRRLLALYRALYRNVLTRVPKSRRPVAAAVLKAIYTIESREAAEAKALVVADEFERMRQGARGSCGTAIRRLWPTSGSRANIGAAYGSTTPSSS